MLLLSGERRPDNAKVTFMLDYQQMVPKNIQRLQKNRALWNSRFEGLGFLIDLFSSQTKS